MKVPIPTSLHWLGDRDSADATRHAMDMTGCVVYFEQQSDCLQFMKWLESQYGAPQIKICPACNGIPDPVGTGKVT
jgi:hypothetical protein